MDEKNDIDVIHEIKKETLPPSGSFLHFNDAGLVENDILDYIKTSNNGIPAIKNEDEKTSHIENYETDQYMTEHDKNEVHVQSVHDSGKYNCEFCDHTTTQIGSLQRHVVSVHYGIKYYCDLCDYKGSSKSKLRTHKQISHLVGNTKIYQDVTLDKLQIKMSEIEAITYNCHNCSYTTLHKGSLQKHAKSDHDGVRYNCDLCDYNVTQKDTLRRHVETIHQGINYDCNLCDFNARSKKSNLRKHMQNSHQVENTKIDQHIKDKEKISKDQVVTYNCDNCSYTTLSKGYFKKHAQSDHDGVRYDCELCDFSVTQKAPLRRHMESIHQGINYNCDLCKKGKLCPHMQYANNQVENTKINKHTTLDKDKNVVTYKCHICSYTTLSKGAFTKHLQSNHDGVRYNCELCDYNVTQKESLRMHMESIHLGINSNCDLCDFKANRKANLNIHMQYATHKVDGVRYNCDLCDYSGTQMSTLQKHVGSVHQCTLSVMKSLSKQVEASKKGSHIQISTQDENIELDELYL